MEKKNKDRKFRARYVVLPIIFIIVIVVGFYVVKNRENLSAVVSVMSTSKDDIKRQQTENSERLNSLIQSITDTDMRELTEKERKELKSGKIDDDTAVNMIMNINDSTDKEENSDNSRKSRKDEIIAKMYLLRARYENSIDDLIGSGKAAYSASKDKSLTGKATIADSIIDAGSALEGQCDAEMETLLSELEDELSKNGEGTGVIAEIRSVYTSEKRLKKEELLSMYYSK